MSTRRRPCAARRGGRWWPCGQRGAPGVIDEGIPGGEASAGCLVRGVVGDGLGGGGVDFHVGNLCCGAFLTTPGCGPLARIYLDDYHGKARSNPAQDCQRCTDLQRLSPAVLVFVRIRGPPHRQLSVRFFGPNYANSLRMAFARSAPPNQTGGRRTKSLTTMQLVFRCKRRPRRVRSPYHHASSSPARYRQPLRGSSPYLDHAPLDREKPQRNSIGGP